MTVDPHPRNPAADILVVDDEVSNLRLLAEILGQAGYRVRSAAEPRLAIESALAFPPSLILLDVMMPDMDGFEVCQRLREHASTRDIPILFVSALNELEHRMRGFEAGGVDYIPKPFQRQEVLARVKTHLQLRDMQVRLEALVTERTAELRE
ncbi:MAG: response regulator, partial [Anaerolineae bacterium]